MKHGKKFFIITFLAGTVIYYGAAFLIMQSNKAEAATVAANRFLKPVHYKMVLSNPVQRIHLDTVSEALVPDVGEQMEVDPELAKSQGGPAVLRWIVDEVIEQRDGLDLTLVSTEVRIKPVTFK